VDLDEALGQLYAADLEVFVAERKRLERELRTASREADAEAIAGRRKPALPVFLANRLARARPRDVEALIAAAERLARAQQTGDAAGVREAGAAVGAGVRDLVEAAEILSRGLSGDVAQRLAGTLRAAATTPAAAEELRRGVLEQEVAPAGFEAFAGVTLPPVTSRKRARPERPEKRESRAAVARRERTARLESELDVARAALAEKEAAAARAEREAGRARRRVADLEAKLEPLRR
jgi:hypothetical protein